MTWFAIGAVVTAALGVASAVQSGRQTNAAAQSQANMDEYNAKMAEVRAKQANQAAGRQEDEQRKRAREAIGMQLASSAEAGAGLNGDLVRQSIFDSESDTQAIRYEGALKAQGLTDDAAIARSSALVSRDRGRQAISGSYLNAASSIAGAGSSYLNASTYKGKK